MSNKIKHRQQAGSAKREAPKKKFFIDKDRFQRSADAHQGRRDKRGNNPKVRDWDDWE